MTAGLKLKAKAGTERQIVYARLSGAAARLALRNSTCL
jgi:hypothetical protein